MEDASDCGEDDVKDDADGAEHDLEDNFGHGEDKVSMLKTSWRMNQAMVRMM